MHSHSHLHRMIVEIMGKMSIHLIIYQKEEDAYGHNEQEKNNPCQPENQTMILSHVQSLQIYIRCHTRSIYIPDGLHPVPASS